MSKRLCALQTNIIFTDIWHSGISGIVFSYQRNRPTKNGLVLNITILLYDVLWNIFFQELVFFITAYICSKAPFKIFIFGRPKTVLPRHQQSLWLRGIAVKNNNISCKTIKVFSFRFITQSSTFYIVFSLIITQHLGKYIQIKIKIWKTLDDI